MALVAGGCSVKADPKRGVWPHFRFNRFKINGLRVNAYPEPRARRGACVRKRGAFYGVFGRRTDGSWAENGNSAAKVVHFWRSKVRERAAKKSANHKKLELWSSKLLTGQRKRGSFYLPYLISSHSRFSVAFERRMVQVISFRWSLSLTKHGSLFVTSLSMSISLIPHKSRKSVLSAL